MFGLHERPDVALEGQKWSSARTRGDGEESDVQTQLEECTRKVFASQHGGQSMVMASTVRTLTLRRAKRVSKEGNSPRATEYGLHYEIL